MLEYFLSMGVLSMWVETLESGVRVLWIIFTPTVGWRAVNMLDKLAIPDYSFEPPTALNNIAVF